MSYYKTEKSYYLYPWKLKQKTQFRRVNESVIAVEKSIAYPEGGGQESDQGFIFQEKQVEPIRFTMAKKVNGCGRIVNRRDFPTLNVEGEVQLHLAEPLPASWDESKPIVVAVDARRRAELSRSHSAAHLVYLAIMTVYEDLKSITKGCKISTETGRFDFFIEQLSPDEMERIQQALDHLLQSEDQIYLSELDNEVECRLWHFAGKTIPCGGTHIEEVRQIGSIKLRKKNLGKTSKRIYYTLVDPLSQELIKQYGN